MLKNQCGQPDSYVHICCGCGSAIHYEVTARKYRKEKLVKMQLSFRRPSLPEKNISIRKRHIFAPNRLSSQKLDTYACTYVLSDIYDGTKEECLKNVDLKRSKNYH